MGSSLAVLVDLDAAAITTVAACVSAIVTFFVLFDRLRRDNKYIKERLKKERRQRKGLTKLCMAIRYDQGRIMSQLPTPLMPSKMDDSGVYDAIAQEMAVDELLPIDDDDEDD